MILFCEVSKTSVRVLKLDFDLNFYTTWQLKFHERIDGFTCCTVDIKKALVRTQFELLSRFLVDKG